MSDNTDLQHVDLSRPKTPREYLRLYLTGFAMGSADIVPGVSGGTMAFILGVYESLINAIKSFDLDAVRLGLKFDFKGLFEKIPFPFLITLGVGLLTAIAVLASLLHDWLENQPTFLFAFFAGLILASIVAIGVKVKWNTVAIIAVIAGAVFAFFIVGFEGAENDPVGDLIAAVEAGEDVEAPQAALLDAVADSDLEDAPGLVTSLIAAVEGGEDYADVESQLEEAAYEPSDPLTLFLSGMIAICAMILPGISGSFILLILGQYAAVLGAVKTLDIISIGAVGAGAAIGIIAFSRVLSWLLKNYYNATVAALVGFMIGAMRLIYTQAVDGIEEVSDTGALDGGQVAFVVVLIVLGFLLVSLLDHMQSRSNPVFAPFWKPAPAVDDIARKAEALE